MHRCPRALPNLLVLSILAGLATTTPTAAVAPPAVIAEGLLRDAGGRPTSGTLLLNLIDPDATSPAAPLLAMGTAGANGRFRLRLDPSPQLSAVAARQAGFLNMRLLAVSADAKGVAMLSRRWDGKRWAPNAGPPQIDLTASAALTAAQRGELDRLRAAGTAAEQRAARGRPSVEVTGATLAGASAIGSDNPYCLRVNDRFLTAYTVIGELHTWRDMTATFGYGTSADSDISAGFSFDGGKTWSLGGQLHVGNATSTRSTKTVSANYYGRTIRSQFEYVKYHYAGWFCYDDTVYQSPWRWTGGGIIEGTSQAQFDGKCGRTYPKVYLYGRNTTWSRTDNDFWNWSAAASVLGLSLKAQSGASSSADLTYTFGSATSYHRICGSDDYPARATRVFAGP